MEKNRCSKSAPRYDYLEYLGRGLSSCILFKALGDFDAKAELGPMGEDRCECTRDFMWEGSSWEQDSTTKKNNNNNPPLQYFVHRGFLSLLPRSQIRQWAQSPLPKESPE